MSPPADVAAWWTLTTLWAIGGSLASLIVYAATESPVAVWAGIAGAFVALAWRLLTDRSIGDQHAENLTAIERQRDNAQRQADEERRARIAAEAELADVRRQLAAALQD